MHLKFEEIQGVTLQPQFQRNSVLNNKKKFHLSIGSHIIIGFQLVVELQERPVSGCNAFGLNSELGSHGVRNVLNIYMYFFLEQHCPEMYCVSGLT